jgi:tetratricopeptide (TPR) repeat protein
MSMQNGDMCKFSRAAQEWDLDRLFRDIETKQLQKLTASEQRNLKALLQELSPKDASLIFGFHEKSLKSAFSDLYRLIEGLVDQPEKSVNYRNVPLVLAKYRKGEFLLGRDENLIELQELRNKYKIVLLKADAGMGKSVLTKYFVDTHFQKAITINMGLSPSEVTPAKEKLSIILSDLEIKPSQYFETNLVNLKNALSDRANPVGVLIDNLEPALDQKNLRFRDSNYDCLLRVLCDRDICSFTLITSRVSLCVQGINHQQFYEYRLKGLDLAAWRDYFRDCKNVETSEALIQMHNFYEGKPEAMARLQGIVSDRDNFDGNIETYWKKYEHTSLADPDLKHLTSVQIDYLQDHQPDVYKLLCRMGCYRYQAVPTVPHEGLICLMWDMLETQHDEIIEWLKKYSLIKIIKGEYSLHPAMREAVKERLEKNNSEWETANRNAAKFWTDSIKSVQTVDDAIKAFESYYHYFVIGDFQLACEIIVDERDDPWEGKQILGRTLLKMGLLQQIKESTINVINKAGGSNSLFKMHRLLGSIFSLTGEIQNAIKQHELSKELSYELEDCGLTAFFNIGICQLTIFDIESAKQSLETTLNLLKKTHYRENLKIDVSCFLAYVHSIIGCQSEVISFAKQATELEKEIKYSHSATFGASYYSLGKAYANIRFLDESFKTYDKAMIFAETTSCYAVIGASLTGQAELYRIQTDFSKALDCHEKSIKLIESIGALSILADTYFEYGLTYQAMGEHDQAEIYKVKAIKLFEEMEAPKQITRVNTAFEQAGFGSRLSQVYKD